MYNSPSLTLIFQRETHHEIKSFNQILPDSLNNYMSKTDLLTSQKYSHKSSSGKKAVYYILLVLKTKNQQ